MTPNESGRRIEYAAYLLLFLSPFIHLGFLHDYADLPQKVFIQTLSFFLLTAGFFKAASKGKFSLQMDPSTLCILLMLLWSLGSIFKATSFY